MGAAWYRARGELRTRWPALLLLVVLVGVAGGAVLTTIAGARRSSTAYDRFRSETLASDLEVVSDAEPGQFDFDAAAGAIRELPGVAALTRTDFPFVVPAGSGFYPYLDFLAALPGRGLAEAEVDLPRLVEGRLPDPHEVSEVAIVESFAEESGLRIGGSAEFESFAPEQMEPLFTTGDAGPPAGPRFTFTVTGILDAPFLLSESSGDFVPRMFLTPAFGQAHGHEVATYPGGFSVRLERGGADVERVTRTIRGMFPDTPLEIAPATEVDRKISSGIDVIVVALLLCAVAAALAGIVAVAQALARHFAGGELNDRRLAALGMTRSERRASHVATAVPVAVLGALLAMALAVVASGSMPVGVARRAEPDPGIAVDGPVLLLGGAAILLAVLVLSAVSAAAVVRRAPGASTRDRARSPSRSLQAIRRTGLAPSTTIGVGMVLEPRGGTALAVRSALFGVVFGMVGVVASVVFIGGVDTLVRSPVRYGAPFDAHVSGFSGDVLAEGGDELLGDPDVARAGFALGGLARVADEEVNSYAFESLKGDMALTLLSGRAPRDDAEVVLGADTLDAAGAMVGDEVVVDGAVDSLRATVVGSAVFPVVDERSSPGRGVLLTRPDFERISSPDEVNTEVLIEWAEGVDAETANAALAEATDTEVFGPRLPSDVNNLREVGSLPRALAAVLALLALLAVLHALVSTVRTRRQDLAVLRTLGFQSRQLGATLVWQAATIGVVGVLAGVPLGLVAGRVVWRAVASGMGVVADPVTPIGAIALAVLVTFFVLGVAALVPGRSARRVAPAAVLRSA